MANGQQGQQGQSIRGWGGGMMGGGGQGGGRGLIQQMPAQPIPGRGGSVSAPRPMSPGPPGPGFDLGNFGGRKPDLEGMQEKRLQHDADMAEDLREWNEGQTAKQNTLNLATNIFNTKQLQYEKTAERNYKNTIEFEESFLETGRAAAVIKQGRAPGASKDEIAAANNMIGLKNTYAQNTARLERGISDYQYQQWWRSSMSAAGDVSPGYRDKSYDHQTGQPMDLDDLTPGLPPESRPDKMVPDSFEGQAFGTLGDQYRSRDAAGVLHADGRPGLPIVASIVTPYIDSGIQSASLRQGAAEATGRQTQGAANYAVKLRQQENKLTGFGRFVASGKAASTGQTKVGEGEAPLLEPFIINIVARAAMEGGIQGDPDAYMTQLYREEGPTPVANRVTRIQLARAEGKQIPGNTMDLITEYHASTLTDHLRIVVGEIRRTGTSQAKLTEEEIAGGVVPSRWKLGVFINEIEKLTGIKYSPEQFMKMINSPTFDDSITGAYRSLGHIKQQADQGGSRLTKEIQETLLTDNKAQQAKIAAGGTELEARYAGSEAVQNTPIWRELERVEKGFLSKGEPLTEEEEAAWQARHPSRSETEQRQALTAGEYKRMPTKDTSKRWFSSILGPPASELKPWSQEMAGREPIPENYGGLWQGRGSPNRGPGDPPQQGMLNAGPGPAPGGPPQAVPLMPRRPAPQQAPGPNAGPPLSLAPPSANWSQEQTDVRREQLERIRARRLAAQQAQQQ